MSGKNQASGNATLELSIDLISAGGDGLGFYQGKAVFVPLTAPGERIVAQVRQDKPDFMRAELLSLVQPSPDRVEAPCKLYGQCGGCNLMHLSYDAQCSVKERILADAFRRSGGLSGIQAAMVRGPKDAYRNRAQFHFGPDKKIGYAKRLSNDIIALDSCPILAGPINEWLTQSVSGDAAWQKLKPYMAGKDRFIVFGQDGYSAHVEGPDTDISISLLGKSIRFHIRGFFQSNLTMLEKLIPDVLDGLSGQTAADLYCGVGVFGSFLKDRFERLVCVEQDPRAVGYACANVGKPADFAANTMEEWVSSAQAKQRFDHVLVDPPRSGLAPRVKAWLASAQPASIGYVSCDPVSLARDSGELSRAGYDLERVRIYDFYPNTSHLESYARFVLR